jgi:hypothetical protein
MEEKTVVPQRPQKSPGLAGFLSIVLPIGVGALYNGQKNKAFIQLLIPFGLIYALARGGNGWLFGLGLAAFYFYQIFDNIQSARAINEAAAGQKPVTGTVQESPEAATSGSVFWGIFLITLGVVLILANFEIILYSTLDNYWPVAVIVIGLKLVADSVVKSKNSK